MKVSIIIPVYNVERYLTECLDSVINQSHEDYEIILVDDGSTDNSGKICDCYRARDTRVKVLHITNSGPLYARITGMDHASGDILVFLDSDDTLRNDALEKITLSFNENNCDMALFNAGETKSFPSQEIIYSLRNGQVFSEDIKKELYFKSASGNLPNSVWSKAIRREYATIPEPYKKLGKIKYGEDLLLSLCFLTNCQNILYIDEGLYHYRLRPGSAVNSFDYSRKDSIKFVHSEFDKFIDIWKMPELRPIHNARKVRGWVQTLKILLENRSCLPEAEFKNELQCMAEDPYFIDAYRSMDASLLSRSYRLLAYCLVKKQYQIIELLCSCMQIVKKLKVGS